MRRLDHIPGPPGPPLVGSLISYSRDRGTFLRETLHRYGDVCRVRLPVRDAVLVGHPEDAATYLNDTSGRFQKIGYRLPLHNLVGGVAFQEGARFREKRSSMASLFAGAALTRTFGRIADTVDARVDAEIDAARDKDIVDLQQVMARLLLTGMLAALFTDPLPPAQVAVVDQGLRQATSVFGFIRLTGDLPNLLRGPNRTRPDAFLRLYRIVSARVRRRRTERGDYDDLLSATLNAHSRDGSRADDLNITNELVLLLSTSYGAMTAAMAHTFARVLADREALSRLYDECAVLDFTDRTLASVRAMRWARACFEESLRLQGSAPLVRIAAEPSTARGYLVPAGVPLVFPVAVIHRDPRWWPEPDRFDPARFHDPASTGGRSALVYLPFGAGPHRCLASQLVYALAPYLLATVLRRFRPELPGGWSMRERSALAPVLEGGLPVRIP
ncbi:cytochrome P450 [Nocardia higoensis]|uniref:cytochrome P450 n=1 Tax=Nocardia higoensis TaxID=228599 RepID=UPI00031E02D6|nr:cytochrome P450 [Nocardia higoensis]